MAASGVWPRIFRGLIPIFTHPARTPRGQPQLTPTHPPRSIAWKRSDANDVPARTSSVQQPAAGTFTSDGNDVFGLSAFGPVTVWRNSPGESVRWPTIVSVLVPCPRTHQMI